jgi:hypothetical protein
MSIIKLNENTISIYYQDIDKTFIRSLDQSKYNRIRILNKKNNNLLYQIFYNNKKIAIENWKGENPETLPNYLYELENHILEYIHK